MTENEVPLFGIVGSIFHELRTSIIYVLSAYSILDGKVPEKVAGPLEEFGKIGKKLLKEIEDDIGNLLKNISLYSSITTSAKLRSFAINWEKDVESLSVLINKIKALNVKLEDPLLDKILNERLSYSLQKFTEYICYLKSIQEKDLTIKHFWYNFAIVTIRTPANDG